MTAEATGSTALRAKTKEPGKPGSFAFGTTPFPANCDFFVIVSFAACKATGNLRRLRRIDARRVDALGLKGKFLKYARGVAPKRVWRLSVVKNNNRLSPIAGAMNVAQ
jgi:hypothetical protein